jgi:signal peptidase I
VQNGHVQQLADKKATDLKKGTHLVRFANVDERLVLWVDRKLPFDDGVAYDPPKERGPTEKNDLEPASIGVKAGGVSVHRLKLWRDTYYTVNGTDPDYNELAGAAAIDWSNPNTWGPLRKLPGKTIYVHPGHYLCMGDNSPESSDGRTWGLVPERLLLGRALLVYFPFGRAGRIE